MRKPTLPQTDDGFLRLANFMMLDRTVFKEKIINALKSVHDLTDHFSILKKAPSPKQFFRKVKHIDKILSAGGHLILRSGQRELKHYF